MRQKVVLIIAVALIVIVLAALTIHVISVNQLRTEMDNALRITQKFIEWGIFREAHEQALDALTLAQRLRDEGSISEIIGHIRLIEAVMRGDEFFDNGQFQAARNTYLLAFDYAMAVGGLGLDYIDERIATTDGFITFFALIGMADKMFEQDELEAALTLFDEARLSAAALSYDEGEQLALAGIKNTKERIVLIKRSRAESCLVLGDQSLLIGNFDGSIVFYQSAAEIYRELGDHSGVAEAEARIESALQKQAEKESGGTGESGDGSPGDSAGGPGDGPGGDAGGDAGENQPGNEKPGQGGGEMDPDSNYDFNRSLDFDLSALIDDQNKSPANLVRMGTTSDRNEGWYNGCGWIATYNALILLGSPKHPAEIVRDFESGGTVLGGIYGTYPNAIERFLSDLGYEVEHVLFPQARVNIDDAIKSAGIGVLGYVHTTAAHYITIKYRAEDDNFVVYNDGYAPVRSTQLGLTNDSEPGAVIDSVLALLQETSGILFSFSLITVK